MLDCVHCPPDFIHHCTSSSSSSLVILHACMFFGLRLSQPITYLKLKSKLPSSQLLQNHSRCDHRQVWSSRVTCQDLQSSSHNSGVMMTFWCQFFVIKPDDILKAHLCHLASRPDQYQ